MIHLIRHARPADAGLMLGQYDSPLADDATVTPLGIEVARVYASPLQRALRTAERCFPDAQLVVLAELAEISHGEWDGKSWSEIEAGWPEIAAAKLHDWTGVAAPGGEAWPEFAARVADAWATIRSGPLPCAIVAHAGVNAVLAQLIDGQDPAGFRQEYHEVISLEVV